ncbi:inositol-pentakisphosphate 2-kinase [Podospora fimiseda]|uniref:Inositol-pentakisphosphate 2-kinase n=1 Tax=Podospora fimiseda TaxID=252190 RepID=A0AAN7H3W9_9PEZI|nr:inositol-pentakisphosphate 2-kinase [Podospora fimiseda]
MTDILNLSDLPLDKCHFNFIGEGAANLVFEVIIDPNFKDIDDHIRKTFQENLIRLPKADSKTHPHQHLQNYWETIISPLFPSSSLVQQRLIKIGGPQIIHQLNLSLTNNHNNDRRHDFRNTTVSNAEYGMLVEDMRAKSLHDLSIEFKPKWLSQSPNAPPQSIRCRTCAREALRSHKKGSNKPKAIPCPLDYIACNNTTNNTSTNPKDSSSLTKILSSPLFPSLSHPALQTWLQQNALLPSLLQAQLSNDKSGVLDPLLNNPNKLSLAMTLRDCSVFLRIKKDGSVEAKLADLDRKDWERKLEYWKGMERDLIEGGYYKGKENPKQITDCLLERGK